MAAAAAAVMVVIVAVAVMAVAASPSSNGYERHLVAVAAARQLLGRDRLPHESFSGLFRGVRA